MELLTVPGRPLGFSSSDFIHIILPLSGKILWPPTHPNLPDPIEILSPVLSLLGFPGGSIGKESACNAGDLGSIPGSGRSLGEGNGYPLQYSCMENSMDRGAWRATVHGITESAVIFLNRKEGKEGKQDYHLGR